MGEGMTESERGSEQRAGGRGIAEFQRLIEAIYFEKDAGRGMQGTLLWFVEEVGELVRRCAAVSGTTLEEEFGDVFAWLVSLASISEVDLEQVAFDKYGEGCPRCQATPCTCG
jgi:NTP pyrophosphatase (non-canonical NTP hydrolase)